MVNILKQVVGAPCHMLMELMIFIVNKVTCR